MGDYAQAMCDVDASDDGAVALQQRLQAWLVDERIIALEVTDCVLSREGGHRPAENYGYAIYGREGTQLDLPPFGANGLEIEVGRRVYWGGDLDAVI